jgi:hypothetical protein
MVARADHFRFQHADLAPYSWQGLITFGFSRLVWLRADYFRFQQAGLALYWWQRRITFGFGKLAWLYTCGKGGSRLD